MTGVSHNYVINVNDKTEENKHAKLYEPFVVQWPGVRSQKISASDVSTCAFGLRSEPGNPNPQLLQLFPSLVELSNQVPPF